MIAIEYAPSFLKQLKKLDRALVDEVEEKIELFRNPAHHTHLRVHKLKGALQGKYSFSVNYRFRIVFVWLSKNEAGLLRIGDHSIYD
jgi:addiction module RelE/StbE family toxin